MQIICQNRGEPSSGCSTIVVNHRPGLLESTAATLPSKFSPSNHQRYPKEPQLPKLETDSSMNTLPSSSHEFADAATAQIPGLQRCVLLPRAAPVTFPLKTNIELCKAMIVNLSSGKSQKTHGWLLEKRKVCRTSSLYSSLICTGSNGYLRSQAS